MERKRCSQIHAVQAMLRPFVLKPMFLDYSEQMKGGKLRPDLIVQYKRLVHAAFDLAPNLSFTQGVVEQSLRNLHVHNAAKMPSWSVPDSQMHSWAKRMALRFRVLCRHVAQSRAKGGNPQWLRMLALPKQAAADTEGEDAEEAEEEKPVDEAVVEVLSEEEEDREEEDEEEDFDDEAEDEVEEPYSFGYDPRKRVAYRYKPSRPKQKELAVEISAPPGASATDMPTAKFRDGQQWPVAALTVEDLQGGTQGAAPLRQHAHVAKRPAGGATEIWTGTRDGADLRLAWRKDRHMLISLYQRKGSKFKQVCQINPSMVAMEGTDKDKQDKSIHVMRQLAEMYAAGQVSEHDLFSERDKLMMVAGFTIRKPEKIVGKKKKKQEEPKEPRKNGPKKAGGKQKQEEADAVATRPVQTRVRGKRPAPAMQGPAVQGPAVQGGEAGDELADAPTEVLAKPAPARRRQTQGPSKAEPGAPTPSTEAASSGSAGSAPAASTLVAGAAPPESTEESRWWNWFPDDPLDEFV